MSLDEPAQKFEDDLEKELTSYRRIWNIPEWANKPLFIFVLSTCLVGLIGFFFTTFTTCRANFASDTERFDRLWQELAFRASQATNKDRNLSIRIFEDFQHYDRATVLGEWKQTLDPSINYLYNENKGRFPYEILSDAQQILRNWYTYSESAQTQTGSVQLLSGKLDSGLMWWRLLFAQVPSQNTKGTAAERLI
jgi:hypothetical protein